MLWRPPDSIPVGNKHARVERERGTELPRNCGCTRQHDAAPQADMEALWRRLVFNVLVSNTDDHLRNHGFLYEGQTGWRWSPAYDLNPTPMDIRPRVLSTAITSDPGDPTQRIIIAARARRVALAQEL
jgi:serine/threonine protein kinase HipA of HipAB toxin-antitoxin module